MPAAQNHANNVVFGIPAAQHHANYMVLGILAASYSPGLWVQRSPYNIWADHHLPRIFERNALWPRRGAILHFCEKSGKFAYKRPEQKNCTEIRLKRTRELRQGPDTKGACTNTSWNRRVHAESLKQQKSTERGPKRRRNLYKQGPKQT